MQQATASTHASINAPEQPRVNATNLPTAYAPTIPLLLNPAPSSREQSPTPLVSFLANAELVASFHNEEQHGTGVNADPEGTQRAGAEGASDRYGRGIGAALVAQLETLATATPSHYYNKIRVINFNSLNFSQAQTLALSFKLSPKEIRSFFQAVFNNPPSKALPYFVGPTPMPLEYVPLVDAGPRLWRRNNGNIPGVNTPFWYISQCDQTPATLHVKDRNLGSLWLFIPKCEKANLECCIKELYGPGRVPCSQEIRYYNAILSPALLEEWGIKYYLDCCLPGEMIITRQNTYHQVLNMSPNVAESVNIEFSDTPDMPVGYVYLSPVKASSNMKRTRIQAITPASKTKKAKGETIGEAMKALDKIEDILSSHSIIRHYYLLCLAERRESLVQEHKLKAAQRTRTRNGGIEKIQKVESLALQDLYYEAFLAQKFLISVLALLSTGSDTGLTNSQIKRVREQDFLAFLDILHQERGEFIQQIATAVDNVYTNVLFNTEPTQYYPFEQVDQDTLCNALFDDKTLLEYCTKTVL
ncbi:hypothetical protein BU23DRAFT_561928 [Bimuria novae-zelandiae CBS 107.79]|uniref:JmjC domain-containing protein n=1 Tax=Bimuria novae-zelandiae CBS 107.79 TaxID=1447943 RepID=A0A6A5UJB5_9PLEO|nr:hypothetical protein BU23DRAFT_561928 [Bimuria novae-zelandiae CBS 107.79]